MQKTIEQLQDERMEKAKLQHQLTKELIYLDIEIARRIKYMHTMKRRQLV